MLFSEDTLYWRFTSSYLPGTPAPHIHTNTPIDKMEVWSQHCLPLMIEAELPASLDTWDTFFLHGNSTWIWFSECSFRPFSTCVKALSVTPILAAYHFIFHCQFNTSHTWKWLCVFEIASFHHSLFLLPLKEGDLLKDSICGNSKI